MKVNKEENKEELIKEITKPFNETLTKINLLTPKYSGYYCGVNEWEYRTGTQFYIWYNLIFNRNRGKLTDIISAD
jgi:hypothetical protein